MNCPSCQAELPTDAGGTCPSCGASVPPPPPPPPQSPYAPPGSGSAPAGGGLMYGGGASTVPWEDESLGLVERFIGTIKLAFTDPRELFENLEEQGLWLPIAFYWIVAAVTLVAGVVVQVPFLAWIAPSGEEAALQMGFQVFGAVVGAAFAPVGLLIQAGIFHLCLMLFGAANRGFEITIRVVAYSYAVYILALIPICGGIVGAIWALVLTIWGAAMAHRASALSTFFAYFLPLLICCGIFIGLFTLVGGMAALQEGMAR